jgi:hypothetical protein
MCPGGDDVKVYLKDSILAAKMDSASTCGANRDVNSIGCMDCRSDGDVTYREEADSLKCIPCDGAGDTMKFVAFMVCCFVVFPLIMKPFIKATVLKQSVNVVVGLTALTIVCFNSMAISSLSSYSIKFIRPLRDAIVVFDIFQLNVDLIALDCAIGSAPSPGGVYGFQVFFPCCVMAFVAVFTMATMVSRKMKIDWHVIFNLLGMLFSFFFVAIAVLSFYPWRCGVQHPFGMNALNDQPSVTCDYDSPEYMSLVVFSLFAMLLYVVFYMTCICWAVYKHQAMIIGQNQGFIRSTRFLFFRWKNESYYWTLCWHLRSLAVALVPVVSPSSGVGSEGAVLQVIFLVTLMTMWLTQSSFTQPWRYSRLNDLDRCCTWLFILMALSGMVGSLVEECQDEDTICGLGVFISIVLVGFGLFVGSFVAREFYRARLQAVRPKADFFLCHTKDTNAIVARAVKFTIEYHSNASVLMSVDSLDNTAAIENARGCKNFVLIWASGSSSNATTALEIATAVSNKRHIVILETETVEGCFEDERLAAIEHEWGPDSIEQFTTFELKPSPISAAMSSLKFVKSIPYSTIGGAQQREDSILALLESASARTLKVPPLSTLPEVVDLFIVHDTRSAQANAAAFVLKNAMRTLNFAISSSSDYENEKHPASVLSRCQHAMVLLHSGVLTSAPFAATILSLDAHTKLTAVTVGSDWNMPSNEQLNMMEKGNFDCDIGMVSTILKKGSPVDSKELTTRYRDVFKSLTMPFSPAGVTSILNAEVGNIMARVKSGKRGTTIGSVLLK